MSANDTLSERGRWINRYLSVSYPLRKMPSVISSFGMRKDPFTGKKAFHCGLDLKADHDDVLAMFDGIVEKTGSDTRSGLFVVIRHGEYTISFCHLSSFSVTEGQEVLSGDVVGISGNTGRSTGPHLHITARRRGEAVDPRRILIYIKEVRAEAILALGGLLSKEDDESKTPADFIRRYADVAMEHQQRYGIPASVTLAQMAYESGWGQSELARKGNNFFGIKASRQWLAEGRPRSFHDDDQSGEAFCNYATVEESVEHHSQLLMFKRYAQCRKHKSTDYHGWLFALKKAGYATNKHYVSECESIINRYKLYRYDALASRTT